MWLVHRDRRVSRFGFPLAKHKPNYLVMPLFCFQNLLTLLEPKIPRE